MKGSLLAAAALLQLAASNPLGAADGPTRPIDFGREVRPLLAKNCFACHGADEKHREGGLRLDLRDAALKKLEDGKTAIVPGHVRQSELVRRITTANTDDRMPPAEANTTLSQDQIGLLTRWIAEGARYSVHWSFEKPVRPAVPRVTHADWAANPVDRFVMAKLDGAGMSPAPMADPHTLIRRLSLDLCGLPPSPGEVDEFVHDASPAAYERLVDRLLADPAFGERWRVPGSTWPATPTRPVTAPIRCGRSGCIAIG